MRNLGLFFCSGCEPRAINIKPRLDFYFFILNSGILLIYKYLPPSQAILMFLISYPLPLASAIGMKYKTFIGFSQNKLHYLAKAL